MEKWRTWVCGTSFLLSVMAFAQQGVAEPETYLKDIKQELQREWPGNRTINLVFHGHSVPAGYFKTPDVRTLDAYPMQVLERLKDRYPYAVINVINTAIGGENAVQGAKRFDAEVLVHRADVLFLDYSLNDLGVGLEAAYSAWDDMIRKAEAKGIKVILMTPSPDQRIDLLDADSDLARHRDQVVRLAAEHGVGLVDSYALFQEKARAGEAVSDYMSQVNHPNRKGHTLIAEGIFAYFE